MFRKPTVNDGDAKRNIKWNQQRWGQISGWREYDQYGYRWGKGHQQSVGDLAKLADDMFRPLTRGRHDLKILEIAPGGGRFTAEIIRYARELVLVDLNEAAIDVCRERFRYYPTPITYVTNDGASLGVVQDSDFDVLVCYDSMVHMHPDIVQSYVSDLPTLLISGGFAWLDHSGRGQREAGHRTAMTRELMSDFAEEAGLIVESQPYRNDWDCISVLRKP